VPGNLGQKEFHQGRLHVLKVVGYVEAGQSLSAQVRAELRDKLRAMRRFHDEDRICPLQKLGRHWRICIAVDASGRGLDTGPVREDMLCGRTATTVLATDEQDMVCQFFTCDRMPEPIRVAHRRFGLDVWLGDNMPEGDD
jgi:hypothetical protein